MSEPLARIETEPGTDGLRLSLSGEVDISNARTLLNDVRRAIADAQPERVVIDLTEVGYIDSQGVMLLLEVAGTLRETDTPLSVVAPPNSVAGQLLALTHIKDLPLELVGNSDGRPPVSEHPWPGRDRR